MRLGIVALSLFVLGSIFAQVDTLFWEDFEGTFLWEVGDLYWYDDTEIYWHSDTFMAFEGYSYWCGTRNVGGTGYNGYNDGWLQYMDMPSVRLPSGVFSYLTFKHKLKCEDPGTSGWPYMYDAWDCAAVWLSSDGGETWVVLTPSTPAYNCASSWAFGFCGLGPGFPAWVGTRPPSGSGYENVVFNLSSYAGETVIVRFVFSSDMMFCTGPTHAEPPNFDATMFGYLVDNILIFSGTADTLLFDDGTGPMGSPTFSQGRVLRTWQLTNTEAYSGMHSAMAKAYCESYSTLISPVISLPDTFAGNLTFMVKCGYLNYDPDDDNSLDDFFSVYVIDLTADTTIRLFYDYYRPPSIDDTWRLVTQSILFNGSTSLRPFAGHDIQLQFLSRGDGLPDSLMHLYIDDVVVSGIYSPLHDISPVILASGPLNLNESGRFTVKVANPGMTSESGITVNGRIVYPDMRDTTITFFPPLSIDAGGYKTAAFQRILNQAGNYTITVWTNLASDLNRHNDTLTVTFTVPPLGIRELGWDDGVNDIATDATSGRTINGFLGGGLSVGDALGNYMYRTAGLRDLTLTKVKFFTNYNGPARIMVMNDRLERPNGAAMLFQRDITVVSEPINGSWVIVDVTPPVSLPDSTFFVFVGTAVDSQMPLVGIDITTPVERLGYFIGSEDTFALQSAIAPYNSIDLMIRCMISGRTGIGDDNPTIPREIALYNNYPDPFNPVTSITFDLPEKTNAKLEVYNILGRKVSTLVDDNLDAGKHKITWNGRDDSGKELPTGVYLYKLIVGDRELTKKMTLIK